MRNLLGGKGANLAEMTNIGLPVPQGFTITTEACTQYYEDGREINDENRDLTVCKAYGKMPKKYSDAKDYNCPYFETQIMFGIWRLKIKLRKVRRKKNNKFEF